MFFRQDGRVRCLHSVKLGPGGRYLLNPQLAQFRLQLGERLQEIVLVLAPEGSGLDLGRRLKNEEYSLVGIS